MEAIALCGQSHASKSEMNLHKMMRNAWGIQLEPYLLQVHHFACFAAKTIDAIAAPDVD